MAKSLEQTMLNLRRDVARWKGCIQELEDMRKPNISEDIKKWVIEAERLIAQWEKME